MAHNHHHHEHQEITGSLNTIFIVSIVLNLLFVLAEAIVGFAYNSLGLLSDAGHNLSDVFSLVLALFAFRMSRRQGNRRFTYGYKKSTVLASLANAIILLVAVGAIIAEGVDKLQNPQPVSGAAVSWTAGIGILINGLTTWMLMKNSKRDLNVRGAFLHMAMDTLVSVGVAISGIIIIYTDFVLIDALISLAIAIIILISTWHLLKESVFLSLDAVPAGVDMDEVEQSISQTEGVKSWHHLHVWAVSTTENAATVHVVIADAGKMEHIKHRLKHALAEKGIQHSTIECELTDTECRDKACC